MNDTTKLKPCPFCGESPKITHSTRGKIAIQCVSDHCDTTWQARFHHTQEEAVLFWNRRAAPEWSTEPPTEPGIYWLLLDLEDRRLVRAYFDVRSGSKELYIEFLLAGCAAGNLSNYCRNRNCQWLKIPEPELPPKE